MSTIRLYFIKRLLHNIKARAKYNNLVGSRKAFERMMNKVAPRLKIKGFTYLPETIAGVKCEWIIPDVKDDSKVLVYFHGGGYAAGSPNTHRPQVSHMLKDTGIKCLSVDYRLSPEHQYPAPIEDATAVYQWLLQNGYKPENIAFGGDSAGGGVTLGTLLYLRDNNIPLPNCAIAISPWIDLTMSGESHEKNKLIDPMLILEGFHVWSKHYLGDADPKSPYASPIFHNLAGLPPIYIQVGEEEMLLDDSVRFAAKAGVDGVDVKLEIFPKLFHVFHGFWLILPEARAANKKLGEYLKEKLQPDTH